MDFSKLQTHLDKPQMVSILSTTYLDTLKTLVSNVQAGSDEKADNSLPDYQAPFPSAPAEPSGSAVAVISINGVIMKGMGLPQEILDFFGIADLDLIDEQLRAVMEDPEVSSVVLA